MIRHDNDDIHRSLTTSSPFAYDRFSLPMDDSGEYVVSFCPEDVAGINEFFSTYGIVVVRVLDESECSETFSDVMELLEVNTHGAFQRGDESTWSHWPKTGMERHGVPSRDPTFCGSFLRNRCHPNVASVFRTLLGTDDVVCNHDRCCFLRPTSVHTEWQSVDSLHFDMNPWSFKSSTGTQERLALSALRYGKSLKNFIFENNQVYGDMYAGAPHLQAVINLLDNRNEDGGFQCVPGFIHHYDQWVHHSRAQYEPMSRGRPSLVFPSGDKMHARAQRVPMKAGSMVVWDMRTPHGSRRNLGSTRPRCAQMLKMFPAASLREKSQRDRHVARSASLLRILRSEGAAAWLDGMDVTVLGLLPKHQKELCGAP